MIASYLRRLRYRAATEMRCFDGLPPLVRRAVRNAPVELDARKIAPMIGRIGEPRVLRDIAALAVSP